MKYWHEFVVFQKSEESSRTSPVNKFTPYCNPVSTNGLREYFSGFVGPSCADLKVLICSWKKVFEGWLEQQSL